MSSRPLAFALVLAIAFVAAPPALSAAERIVEATGEGELSVAPDQAILTLGVTTDAPTAKQALDDNARVMSAVIAALAQAGFAGPDVSTRAVSLMPLMDHRPNAEPGSSATVRATACK